MLATLKLLLIGALFLLSVTPRGEARFRRAAVRGRR